MSKNMLYCARNVEQHFENILKKDGLLDTKRWVKISLDLSLIKFYFGSLLNV